MFKKFKKHFNKILIACLTLISSIAIFTSINKTYAYETDKFSYTYDNLYTNADYDTPIQKVTYGNYTGYEISNGDYYIQNTYDIVGGMTYALNYVAVDINTNQKSSSYVYYNFTMRFNSHYSYAFGCSVSYNTAFQNNDYFTFIGNFSRSTYSTIGNDSINISFNNAIPSNIKVILLNLDFIRPSELGLSRYYDTYYGSIEDNYNQLLNDYNDLQDNYNDLQGNYLNLQVDYGTLQQQYNGLNNEYSNLQDDYQNLQNNYDSLDDSLSHNVINELIGNNYFTKSNIQLLQNENYFEHNDYQTNPYGATTPIYAMISNYIDNKTLYIGSALEWVSNNNFYNNQNYNSSYFTWLNLIPYYNYSSSMVTNNGVSRWDSTSSVNPLCKYVNLSIISSRDILIEVVIKDSSNNYIYQTINRDSNTGNYLISFDNDDERVFAALRLQCKLSNGVYYTADRIISNTGNITDNQYELGFQNGSVSSQATINALNNDIRDLNEQITTANLTIESLKEQISSISSDYNLNNLIWAIGGTPFESFKQIWNVDFFGVNIAEIITGFLTALIALYIIKKFFR